MPDDTAGCAFGTSLSLTKGLPYRLAVGAPSCNNATGAVAVFAVSPALDSYALEVVLTNPASSPGDKFGFIVSAIGEKGFCAIVVRCDCGEFGQCRSNYSTKFYEAKIVYTLKGLALLRASRSGEIALAGSSRAGRLTSPAFHACGSACPFRASCCQRNRKW